MTDFTGFTAEDGEEITPVKQAKMAETIGKLVAMSADESLTDEARASYAEKAEKLMRQYRVNEENVISSGGEAASTPIFYRIALVEQLGGYYASEFQDAYRRIWNEIKRHAGLQGHMEYEWNDDRSGVLIAVGYGYEIDIRLAQFLWTSAHLTFATRVEARLDRSLSDQLNCYYMRGSGQERNDIATALWGSAPKDGAAHGKVQRLYLAECAARGEEPAVGGRGFVAHKYRQHYAEAFVDQFGWRLRDARSAVDAESGGLVLHGRDERVAEAYWAAFPDKRPASAEEVERRNAERRAMFDRYQAEAREKEAECILKGKCAAAMKRAEAKAEERGYGLSESERSLARCRQHKPYEPSQADERRWARERNSPERSAGRRAGAAAASSVEFRRTGGERTQKAEAAPNRPSLGN